MARPRKPTTPAPKVNRRTPRWFYLDDKLHERLHVNRPQDVISCWDYSLNRQVIYGLSDVKKKMKVSYDTKQVGVLVNRAPLTLLRYIERGNIRPPQKGIRGGKNPVMAKYRWSDKNILEAHDWILNQGFNDPLEARKPMETPTRRELRALLNQEDVMYVLNDDGNFVPTWRAKEF